MNYVFLKLINFGKMYYIIEKINIYYKIKIKRKYLKKVINFTSKQDFLSDSD